MQHRLFSRYDGSLHLQDHLHAKLFPMHGTQAEAWQRRSSNVCQYFDRSAGYLSSHDHKRADEADLAELAGLIRG